MGGAGRVAIVTLVVVMRTPKLTVTHAMTPVIANATMAEISGARAKVIRAQAAPSKWQVICCHWGIPTPLRATARFADFRIYGYAKLDY